jgi:D-alanine-D-alanine ligase
MSPDLQGTHVTVLMGGTSAEREVSLKSGAAVANALTLEGVRVTRLDTATPNWHQDLPSDTFVFNLLHGAGGEDGRVQGLLETLGVAYSGSGVLGSALSMDKVKTKQVWKSLDLPTPAFEIIDEHSDLAAVIARLNSVFVKPISEGSSVGMAAASDAESLRVALINAQKSGVPVMAEQFVSGEEYTVAILRGRSLPPIKITPESDFYDYNAKYVSGTTRFECPAPLSVNETQALQALAYAAFVASGAEVWGRVDMIRGADGWQLLEVNTVPGMTEHSLVPKAAEAAELRFIDLLDEIYLGSWELRYAA